MNRLNGPYAYGLQAARRGAQRLGDTMTTPTPPDMFDSTADAVWQAILAVQACTASGEVDGRPAIAAALRSAHTVPPGYVRVGDTDKRLLGRLIETNDGCVIGHEGSFYRFDSPRVCEHARLSTNGASMYSTPEAAAAAVAATAAKGAKP